MNGIVELWKSSLSSLEKFTSTNFSYSYFIKKKTRSNNDDDNNISSNISDLNDENTTEEEEILEGNNRLKIMLQNTISWNYLLITLISTHEKQFCVNKKKEVVKQSNQKVTCGSCGLQGYFQDKKSKLGTTFSSFIGIYII